jgi:hypothetical protein
VRVFRSRRPGSGPPAGQRPGTDSRGATNRWFPPDRRRRARAFTWYDERDDDVGTARWKVVETAFRGSPPGPGPGAGVGRCSLSAVISSAPVGVRTYQVSAASLSGAALDPARSICIVYASISPELFGPGVDASCVSIATS